MLIYSRALAIVAADVVTLWGNPVTDDWFLDRTVKDAVGALHLASRVETAELEQAIYDNIWGYCVWAQPNVHSIALALNWVCQRPSELNPLRYKTALIDERKRPYERFPI